jgi:hypothetical protein
MSWLIRAESVWAALSVCVLERFRRSLLGLFDVGQRFVPASFDIGCQLRER